MAFGRRSFKDKVIVITGASEGIGAELARQLARDRPHLVLGARRLDALRRVADRCETQFGARAIPIAADVADAAQCRALVQAAVDHFGRIDILVNNAGISMHALFEEITDLSTFERLMQVNFFGSLWCTHAALPYLKASRGLVVGVSSLAGLVGVPGRTAYCATKHAMTGFFDALRTEIAPQGVDVTMIYPGVVATEIRRRGWDGNGAEAGVSGLEESGAMPVETCVRIMLRAMRARRREVVMTAKARFGRYLRLVAPEAVDNMARAALAKRPAH